jgi:uncharacterized lipoprotein YmbA
MYHSPTALVTTSHNIKADVGFFGVSATGLGSFSLREKVRMRETKGEKSLFSFPHPCPLPQGEGFAIPTTVSWEQCIVTLCVLVLFVTGCASTPAARYYTLSAASAPAAASSDLSVVVGPVSVPDEVDRPQLVVRTGPNQMRVDEFNLWASPLQSNISRVVAENLVVLLGTPHVTLFPQTLSVNADYRVAVEVQRFQSTLGQSAILDAVWTVRRMSNGKSKTGRTDVREMVQENSYEVLAASHSRAVARLSQDIATAVQALERSAL